MQTLYLFLYLFTAKPVISKAPLKITVLYFSAIDKNLKAALIQNITATYNCIITEKSGIYILPEEAYYKPRNRYRAPVLLKYLDKISGCDKIIGITTKDISTTSNSIYDWGIIGLGTSPGKSCVVSTYRIKTADKNLFNDRFIKVSLHEIGHTLGLPHCTFSNKCFMEAAEGTVKSVDRETRFLCPNCKKLISPYIQQH